MGERVPFKIGPFQIPPEFIPLWLGKTAATMFILGSVILFSASSLLCLGCRRPSM